MTLARGAGAVALVVLMALGSVIMWLGAPLFWVWLASQTADSSQATGSSFLIVMGGIVVSFGVLGKLLAMANRAHMRITDQVPARRDQTVWMRSMRGERTAERQHGILGTIMAISVSIALACLGVWFFFFAEGGGI